MNKFITYTMLVLILSLSFLLAACSPNVEPTAEPEAVTEPESVEESEPAPTEVPTVAPTEEVPEIVAEGVQLDPAILDNEDLLRVCSYIFETLVREEDSIIVPALATSWKISDDGLDYIFELRPNVTFQDGTRFDADLVIANFNRWFDQENPLHNADATFYAWQEAFLGFKGEVDANNSPISPYDGIEKINNLSVLIHLNREDPQFLQKIAQPSFGFIVPDLLSTEGDLFATSQGSIVGTGPYTVGEWSNEAVVLTPNEGYWDTPAIPNLEFPLP
jgi:peptide/nickel transport system substrate-binding protein